MKKAEKEELNGLFKKVIHLFKKRCFICREPYNTDEAWTIHHRDYVEGEKIYSDFRIINSKGKEGPDKLNYYRYLIPIVLKNPKRFYLLHHKHHWMAESWARLKRNNFERMVKVAREINKRRYSNKTPK